jgi:capsular polysaccharide biosynthesis protein
LPVVINLCDINLYAAANPREVGCIRIAPEERRLAPAPKFFFGPVPDHLPRSLFDSLRIAALGCYVIRDGGVGYDGFALHGGTTLFSPVLNTHLGHVQEQLKLRTPAGGWPAPRRIPGQAACIHGPGYNVYGHWLVDFLPRLFILQAAGYDIFKLRYALPADCPPFGREFLRLAGIPPENLLFYNHYAEQVEFDEVILPTTLRTANRLHSAFRAATRAWMGRIFPGDPPPHGLRKIFVSRKDFPGGRWLRNRDTIEDMAQSAGFEIVQPEKLGVREQIALFRSARQVIGEYGSALHNTIFGGPSLHCCALRGTSHPLGFIQSDLAHAFGQSMSYVFGEADMHAVTYEFEIYEPDFARALECLRVEEIR